MKKVALIGLGAMGVLYSDLLYSALQDDFFVIADKKRIDRYETEGVYCNGARCQFPYRSATEAEPVDLLLVGVKFGGLQAVGQLFDKAEIPYTVSDTIIRKLWSKLMLNTGINQVVMVQEGTYATVQQPGVARDRMIAAMREVMQVANAEGIDLNEGDVQGWLQIADGLNPDGMPSMRQDGLAKRYSEVELFSGTIIPLAQKHHLAVPTCAMLYQQIKEIEAEYK